MLKSISLRISGIPALLVSLVLLSTPLVWTPLSAQEMQSLPQMQGRVTDKIGLLTKDQISNFEKKLEQLDNKTGAELVVVIVDTTQPEAIEDYSLRLAESWKIGKKNSDNGVILLIAKNDRKLRIEVGYGLEETLSDARSKQIISDLIVPEFKSGDFSEGIEKGIDRIIYVIENRQTIDEQEALQAAQEKEAQRLQKIEDEQHWFIRRWLQKFYRYWLIPCGLLGAFLLFKEHTYLGFFIPAALYGIPVLLIGLFFDLYFLEALYVLPIYLFIYFIIVGILSDSGGGSYSGSSGSGYRSSGGSSSYSSSSYSSSSSSSSSGSSYSGGGGSFGGGGSSGSW